MPQERTKGPASFKMPTMAPNDLISSLSPSKTSSADPRLRYFADRVLIHLSKWLGHPPPQVSTLFGEFLRFSSHDVSGAGKGRIPLSLMIPLATNSFTCGDAFALCICGRCHFLSHMREIILHTQDWLDFNPNQSERFEADINGGNC